MVVDTEWHSSNGVTVTSAVSSSDVAEIVASTLCVARLGEADLRNWWASRGFSAAGRVVLKQRLPRTWRMAAVELDLASAANRHNRVMNRSNAVHLFSDYWPVRRWSAAWVAEQKTASQHDLLFEQLETATLEQIEAQIRTGGGARPDAAQGAIRIGTIESSSLADVASITAAVRHLAHSYVGRDTFVVPYLEVIG